MDEQIKPVVWRCVWTTAEGECEWSQYHDAFDPLPSVWDEAPDEVHAYYDQQAIDTLRAEVERLRTACDKWSELELLFGAHEDLQARAERAEAEARRWRFCIERDVMPVVASDGKTWCMFVSVTSRRRSLFTGKSPAEAVDAAIDAAKQGAE